MSKTFTTQEVAQHKTEKDMWLIVENGVYDITGTATTHASSSSWPQLAPQISAKTASHSLSFSSPHTLPHHHPCSTPYADKLLPAFQSEHPGGEKILKRFAGKNATKVFWKYHNEKVLEKYGGKLKIGEVAESAKL
ncbi:cytochrome b5-like Heme/Steroid binding domain-containing protein [Colletotrichum nymphaeae SA-01]|uniref:Cytochrome b5-like Heme/Steroid binding domain-containing protein n=1 Tax=Colletotrichum nymphaeae SA-01 TaxID=1460502 RepID=A0A135S898_9PEZI|nr:cytochrome b5-like Heme/Steroid binding domain-containing protein [Colletotrichum nymphaeae SA-01]